MTNMTSSDLPSSPSEILQMMTLAELPHTPTDTVPNTTSSDPMVNTSSKQSSHNTHTNNYLVWFVLDVVLAIFIMMGNSLTLAAVGRIRTLQTQANMQVVSLALADILASLYLILDAVWVLPVSGNVFDDYKCLCLLKDAVLYLCLSSSMLTMICIAVDKLLYVATPFLHRRAVTGERTLVVIAVCWLLSLLYGSAVCYVNVFQEQVGCQAYAVLNPVFVFFGNTTPVALAVVVIAGCYLEIIHIVAKQRRKIQALNQPCDLDRDSYKKSLKLFLTVLGVFLICWAPFVVEGFLHYVSEEFEDYHRAFLLLALSNSGLNFFIYAWKNKDFRAAYKRLLTDSCKADSEV